MGNFTEIKEEYESKVNSIINSYLNECRRNGFAPDQNRINQINNSELMSFRMTKMMELSKKTGRNTICYFSAWLQGNIASPNPEIMIYDNDMNGFMNAVSKMDKTKGLDLIIHTPGGVVTAAESIVKYLKKMFNSDIRVIVPHLAMSAGTMIACSSKEIIMGKESSLGPVDPQYHNVPAQGVLKEFERAMEESIKVPNRSLIWKEIIKQYRPTFLGECENAIRLSEELVREWLADVMFKKSKNKNSLIDSVLTELTSHEQSMVHDRHYDYEKCKKIGLKVVRLEDDSELQDKVLSVYHSYLLSTYFLPTAIKFIEGNNNASFVINGKR